MQLAGNVMIISRREAETRLWWAQKQAQYPFHATAPGDPRPELVDEAVFISGVFNGRRIYGFKTEAQRDKFVEQFKGQKI